MHHGVAKIIDPAPAPKIKQWNLNLLIIIMNIISCDSGLLGLNIHVNDVVILQVDAIVVFAVKVIWWGAVATAATAATVSWVVVLAAFASQKASNCR